MPPGVKVQVLSRVPKEDWVLANTVAKGSFQIKEGALSSFKDRFKSIFRASMSFSSGVPALILSYAVFAKFKNSSLVILIVSVFLSLAVISAILVSMSIMSLCSVVISVSVTAYGEGDTLRSTIFILAVSLTYSIWTNALMRV